MFIPCVNSPEQKVINIWQITNLWVKTWELIEENDSRLVSKICCMDNRGCQHDLTSSDTLASTEYLYQNLLRELGNAGLLLHLDIPDSIV